jgi:hypothetical protein
MIVSAEGLTEYDFTDQWETYNYYSTYYGMRLNQNLLEGTIRIQIHIPQSSYNLTTSGGIASEIRFNDAGGNSIKTIAIADLVDNITSDNDIDIWLDNFGGTDVTDAVQVRINVMQNFTAVPHTNYAYWRQNAIVTMLSGSQEIRFYAGGAPYETQYIFEELPTRPTNPNPPTNHVFVGWRTITGEYYGFMDELKFEWIGENGYLLLAAVFVPETGYVVPSTNSPFNTPDIVTDFMTGLNLHTSVGYMIVYSVLMTALMILLLVVHAPAFVTVLAEAIITGLFIYMDVMPTFATILIFIALALVTIVSTRGGNENA